MLELRSLKSIELESWFDHCALVFYKTPRDYFVNHFYNDPWKDINSIFVAVENGKILSTLKVFKREIYLNQKTIRMGGIGEVSTIAEARRKGLSSQLLRIAIEYMKNENINISMLFGNEPIYVKNGWQFLNTSSKISSLNVSYKGLYNIRKLDLQNDIEELKVLYNNYSSKYNGALVRNNDYYWTNWFKNEAKNCFIAENSNKKLVGYISLGIENNIAVINDFAMNANDSHVFEDLSSFACNELGISKVIKYPKIINTNLDVQAYEKNDYNMIRLISPFELDNKLITKTEELASILDSNFLFWNVDGF